MSGPTTKVTVKGGPNDGLILPEVPINELEVGVKVGMFGGSYTTSQDGDDEWLYVADGS